MPVVLTAPRLFYRRLIVVGMLAIAAVVLWRAFRPAPLTPRLMQYGAVPDFSLTERSGRTITRADLQGKIWIADFIFTTCPGPCPLITADMARLQSYYRNDPRVQFVTFTVDPQDDTPPVLTAYANMFHADPARWWFLTGAEKPLYDLIQNGFMQVVQDNHGQKLQPGEYTVTHSTRLVVVDGVGEIRGFFDGIGNDGGLDDLKRAVRSLERESQ